MTFRGFTEISSKADVRTFFDELLADGINFHPDTCGEEYEPPIAARRYNAAMARCFDIGKRFGFDVYSVACDAMSDFLKHATVIKR